MPTSGKTNKQKGEKTSMSNGIVIVSYPMKVLEERPPVTLTGLVCRDCKFHQEGDSDVLEKIYRHFGITESQNQEILIVGGGASVLGRDDVHPAVQEFFLRQMVDLFVGHHGATHIPLVVHDQCGFNNGSRDLEMLRHHLHVAAQKTQNRLTETGYKAEIVKLLSLYDELQVIA